jgi:spermidine synthase
VLVLEIAAGRLLAPYVGVSLTTYTGIIGVILAGIAVGAWLGGLAADRRPPETLVGPTLAAGGAASILSVPVVDSVGGLGIGDDLSAIVILATVGFVLPAVVLSAVGPMIVRASLTSLDTSGALVGRLSAIATAGAISGTFLTGFVLLGLFPTRVLIVGTGGVLVVIGLATAVALRRGWLAALAGALAAAVLAGPALATGPCDRESAYYCISVVPDPANPEGRTLVLDRVRHAYVDLGDPLELRFRYVRWFAAAAAPVMAARSGNADVLHVGGGGLTFPRYLAASSPLSRHTVLELDPVVLATAREELGFSEGDRIRVVLGDARLSIGPLADGGFDLVVGDAFGGLSVPWHLTTREFVAEIERVLRPGGRYVMNLIDGEALRFARAQAATLQVVFPNVALLAGGSSLAGRSGGNVVLIASAGPLDTDALRLSLRTAGDLDTQVVDGSGLEAFIAEAPVLSDDFAPVDQLTGR